MSEDWLDKAARELQQTGDRPHSRPRDEELSSILRDVRKQARRRRIGAVAMLQVAILLVGFGAWAAGTGQFQRLFQEMIGRGRAPGAAVPSGRASQTSQPPLNQHSAPMRAGPIPLAEAPLEEAPPAASPAVARRRKRAATPLSPREAPIRIPAMSDDASALPSLYQQAHEAHFIAKDWGRAAKLWDAYLRGPDKRFALEARFNHGVALFRLGQVSEAEAALRPFVDGDYGSYRQEDARRLLQRAKLRVP